MTCLFNVTMPGPAKAGPALEDSALLSKECGTCNRASRPGIESDVPGATTEQDGT
eukprot:CAMPEP_0176237232 /NCGR_PEP_ID=MMETSP0121_2-20121125/27746_1 /TAXON_ID=160619 /ORGANISM="Kryptoperidinium foliaceum, Strain CCMP 1326" /LENGTH=54 /DNA_ID=CAMNT_0017576675 /DNA_START=203 /DNA_END=368 /DNA_ORIENTATION=+